jgi:hypothetical protein
MSSDLDTLFEHREKVKKPGWRKALPWVAGALIVAAALAFTIVKFSNTAKTTPEVFGGTVKDVSKNPKNIKLTPGATKVAREFIRTAVAHKDLARAYEISGPGIRQGQTKQQFLTGNIAVVPYPVEDLDFAPMKIDYSYPAEAMIEVALLPKKGAKVKSQIFFMDLKKLKNGKWVVDSWVPRAAPLVPSGSSGAGNS